MKKGLILMAMVAFFLSACAGNQVNTGTVSPSDVIVMEKPAKNNGVLFGVQPFATQKGLKVVVFNYGNNPMGNCPELSAAVSAAQQVVATNADHPLPAKSAEWISLDNWVEIKECGGVLPSASTALPTATAQGGGDWPAAPTVADVAARQAAVIEGTPVPYTITLMGLEAKTEVIAQIISKYWNAAHFEAVDDSSREETVLVKGRLGEKEIPFSDELIGKLKRLLANPNAGAGLTDICPTQAGLLHEALGEPGKVSYVYAKCSNCAQADPIHLKACTQPFARRNLNSGVEAVLNYCQIKGNNRDGNISVSWKFDPVKSNHSDGWYLSIVRYSTYQPIKWDWPADDHLLWTYAEELSAKRPEFNGQPKLYATCGWQRF